MKKLNFLLIVLLASLWLASSAFAAIIVGRIAHLEGQIYRFMDVDQSWVETFIDSPAGTLDVLATGPDSRAELKFPNNVLIRLDQETEIEIVELREDSGVFTLKKGLARFYNDDAAAGLVIDTVQGTAAINPGNSVDIKIDGAVVTIAAAEGETSFQTDTRQEIVTGSTILEFKPGSVEAGTGPLDPDWNLWCENRESTWSRNRVVRSDYLPETMQEYAYILEPAGRWSRVYYRGYYYWGWRPLHVPAGWAPYTTGYWYDWHDEPVWIDYNPWGWVTHHHGHWLFINDAWLWTPYVHVSFVPNVTVVGLNIHFGKRYRPYWHPGRVRWISSSRHVGWLPLAPWETYYGRHRWGPRNVVVSRTIDFKSGVNLSRHRHIDHAVVVPRRDFQHSHPVARDYYSKIRLRNIEKNAIVKNYRVVRSIEPKRSTRSASKLNRNPKRLQRQEFTPRAQPIINKAASRQRQHFSKSPATPASPKKELGPGTADNRRPRALGKRGTRSMQKSYRDGRQNTAADRIGADRRTRTPKKNWSSKTVPLQKQLRQEQKTRPDLAASGNGRIKALNKSTSSKQIRKNKDRSGKNHVTIAQPDAEYIRSRRQPVRQTARPKPKAAKQEQIVRNQVEYSGEYDEIGGRNSANSKARVRIKSNHREPRSYSENRAGYSQRGRGSSFSAAVPGRRPR